MTRKVRPGFSHEETLHDGTAQSVMNEETPRDRSGRLDIDSQEEAWPQQFVIGNDEAELDLLVESRSFVNRVNDQVRKRQKRISNVTENGEKHSMIWGMFMAVTMESAVFMGKNYHNKCHSIVNTTDLTLKQMFDISAKLVAEQDEISGLETIGWENHSWKQTRSSEDSKSLNVEQTDDRTGRLVTDTAAVQDDSQVYHEANTLNVNDEVLRQRMEKSIVVHDENHERMMVNEADMDFKIPGLPHSVVKHAQSTSVR